MKVDLPIEQMEVKEVEEEQNSYKEDPRPESGGDSPAINFPTHPNSTATPRSYPSKTNKDTKGEEMSSKKCGI
ncbi:hypothetical protein R3I94_011704 [Phoxinus phoxinus]